MRFLASVLQFASFLVRLNLTASIPSFTSSRATVCKDMWFTAIVLPTVGVYTFFAEVFTAVVVKRAPNCLEVEHVEVCVFFHEMEQFYAQLFLRVSEGTQMTELAV